MMSFEKTTVQYLPKFLFRSKVMKFVVSCIPSFDRKVAFMKKNVDDIPFIQKWNYSTCVPFKSLITEH